jgi:hypothetical protein
VKHQEDKRHFSRDAVGEGRQIELEKKDRRGIIGDVAVSKRD